MITAASPLGTCCSAHTTPPLPTPSIRSPSTAYVGPRAPAGQAFAAQEEDEDQERPGQHVAKAADQHGRHALQRHLDGEIRRAPDDTDGGPREVGHSRRAPGGHVRVSVARCGGDRPPRGAVPAECVRLGRRGDTHAVASRALGGVQRLVRTGDEGLGIGLALRRRDDAEAASHSHFVRTEGYGRPRDHAAQHLGDDARGVGRRIRQHHQELLAAVPALQVGRPQHVPQETPGGHEHGIAGEVAMWSLMDLK